MPADFPWTQADAMYLLLVRRADQLRAHRGSAYFLTHNAGCKLVLTLADDDRYAPVRFEAAIADGSSKHYPFAGKSLEFLCQNQGQAMRINTHEAVATNR